jgi:hypothetical protein
MKRRALIAGFVIAALLTAFFLLRLVFFTFIWMESPPGAHPIEGWMTPRYISRTYRIPPPDLQAVLALGPNEHPRQSLKKIARARGLSITTLIAEIEALVPTQPAATQPIAVQPTAVQPTATKPTAVQPTAVQPNPIQPAP